MNELVILLAAVIVAAAILWAWRKRVPAGNLDTYLARDEEATRTLQARVDQAAGTLSALTGAFEERRRLEEQSTAAVERIERLVAGSFSKGRVGENLLHAALGELPPEMLVHDFRLGGRVCEFALAMTDGRYLPIDSKWGGFDLLEELESARSVSERDAVRRRIDLKVCSHIREVAGYIDPSLTVPLAVVAVPDGVYVCCRKAHAAAAESRVTIVSYSNALPLLLSIWNLHRAYVRDLDSEQLLVRVHEVANSLAGIGEQIEGRLSRSLTAATNASAQIRVLVSAAQASLQSLEREASKEPAGDRALTAVPSLSAEATK